MSGSPECHLEGKGGIGGTRTVSRRHTTLLDLSTKFKGGKRLLVSGEILNLSELSRALVCSGYHETET